MGVERIGDESADADAELLAMTVECLLAAGLTEFQVSVGQVDYFKSLLKEAELGPEAEERLRVLISQKNSFGVEEFVEEQKLKDSMQKAFTEIPQMFGSEEVLKKARSLTNNACALEAVSRLEEIYEIMKNYGYEKYISFDFGMLSKYQYYTGIIFQAYTYGTGEPMIKGGRYNGLMKHFATYNIRRKIAAMLLPEWWEYVYIEGHFEKFVLKNKYNHRKQLIKHIKKHGSKKYLTAWDC